MGVELGVREMGAMYWAASEKAPGEEESKFTQGAREMCKPGQEQGSTQENPSVCPPEKKREGGWVVYMPGTWSPLFPRP